MKKLLLLSAILLSFVTLKSQSLWQEQKHMHGDHACNHKSCGLEALNQVMNTHIGPPADFVPGADRAVVINVTYNGFSPAAQIAFQHAIDIWSSQLTSSVPIAVNANWVVLGPSTLGSAGPSSLYRDFGGAPVANTFYPLALANSLQNADLDGGADIDCNFNSNFANWYLGIDGNCPPGSYDLVTVILHELCHGLGFIGSANFSSPNGFIGLGNPVFPTIYDRFVETGPGTDLTSLATPSVTLGNAIVGNDLWWLGALGGAANGGTRPRIYAPGTWAPGSSYSHLDEAAFPAGDPNSLMTYALGTGEVIHNPGPVVLGIFDDMGWQLGAISGCMDQYACNYNPLATSDDGSCDFSGAQWYIPNNVGAANTPLILSCNPIINYTLAVYQNCIQELVNIDPYCVNVDWDNFCVNGYNALVGCTDGSACNYNPDALCDDGSCIAGGCDDPAACNYNAGAACNDGSCTYPGCLDPAACNYNAGAGCDNGSCLSSDCAGICGGLSQLNDCGECITPVNCSTSLIFSYTGAEQLFIVPDGTTSLNIQVYGAQGGGSRDENGGIDNDGGLGGLASGTLSVTPGDVLYVTVGGQGGVGEDGSPEGGFNGGGDGGYFGAGGGGASDIRTATGDLNTRVIVAGGGGGGNTGGPNTGAGGNGGGLIGDDGSSTGLQGFYLPGGGGSQIAGGTAGQNGVAGILGFGANLESYHASGGGGGWYGGGSAFAAGGGGGSSYIDGVSGGITAGGVQSGDGLVVISISTIEYLSDCNAGCNDPNAINYDSNANFDNGSCLYLDECGNTINQNGDGVGFVNDFSSANWNVDLTTGDGSVNINTNSLTIVGTNELGIGNVNTNATLAATQSGNYSFDWSYSTLDFSPDYDPAFYINGTAIQLSVNNGYLNQDLMQNGTMTFFANDGDLIGFAVNSIDGCCGEATLVVSNFTYPVSCVFGCTDPNACNFDPNATNCNNTCDYSLAYYLDCAGNCLYDSDFDGVCDELEVNGCTDPSAINYNANITENDGSCLYAGCTDPLALNYDAGANFNNGSCTYISGCTYPDANNYNASAIMDDGSCVFPAGPNTCPEDIDGNGQVNTGDLLQLLASFGATCP